ncbi:addiction module antidote protein [Endozoicomonas arenosclerae]|uniref:addiction module antidote protein n=1 Tax=Endozoicomonas arenosclerae TaxID=1633495 RepID=UPI000784B742|nr:addiction module antidote protein [Endozoicomonas arenosclerae]
MKDNLKPYNPFDNALTDEDIPWFLTEAYLDEDPAVFITALGHIVKYKGVAQLAEQTGLNRESLYKTFNGKVQPRWDTVHRLLKALGVKLEIAA